MTRTYPRTYQKLTVASILGSLAISLALMPAVASADGEVSLYSARKEKLIKPLLDKFTTATGITVNLVTGKADALLKRLIVEGQNSPADLFITTDAGRLHRGEVAGVLQKVESDLLNKAIPSHLRDKDGILELEITRSNLNDYLLDL